jgi:hypothetical protein
MLSYLDSTVAPVFQAWKIRSGKCTRHSPSNVALDSEQIFAELDSKESHLSEISTPAISHNPIRYIQCFIVSPSDDRDAVIVSGVACFWTVQEDSAMVVQEGSSIDGRLHGTPQENLGLNGKQFSVIVVSKFCYRSIWKILDGGASAIMSACQASVGWST